jgi:hypothetical protein
MEETMKGKGIKILLVASIALNLAFLSTTIFKRYFSAEKKKKKEIVIKTDLNIKEDQKEKIQTIVKKFRVQLVKLKQDILDKRIEIIEELSDPEFNFEILKTKTEELNEFENLLNDNFINTLIKINNLLDSKQRLGFLLRLSKNWFFISEPSSTHHTYKWNRR